MLITGWSIDGCIDSGRFRHEEGVVGMKMGDEHAAGLPFQELFLAQIQKNGTVDKHTGVSRMIG